MTKKLHKSGNSMSLIITKTMREHLGVTDEVDVQFAEGQIILRKPLSVREASRGSGEKYREAYRRLAE